MDSKEKTSAVTNSQRTAPRWPSNNKIFMSYVNSHNELVEAGNIIAKQLNGSESITLVMVCAAMNLPVPFKYKLDTKRAKGISDHPTYVKEYILAACGGLSQSAKGGRIEKQVRRFVEDFDISVNDINRGLEKALKPESIL